MVQHGCNCSGYSDYIRMVTIKNNHCCNNSHGVYNSVWTHGCGAGCTGGSFWGGFGTGVALSLTNWLMGGLCSMGSWFGGFGFGNLGFGGFGMPGMLSLTGNNGGWFSGSQNSVNDDYLSNRYGGKRVSDKVGEDPNDVDSDPAVKPDDSKGVDTDDAKIEEYKGKLNASGLTQEQLEQYKTELVDLKGKLTDNHAGDKTTEELAIDNLLSNIEEKLQDLQETEDTEDYSDLNADELELLAKRNEKDEEYIKYPNAKPEDLTAEGAKVLYARDIVGQANGTIRDVKPENNNDKVTISTDGKTITIQDSKIKGETKEVKYTYVDTVNDEALYKSENGQLYVLQKISTGEYVLNQYSWHKGSGEKDVSSANV